MTHTSRAPTRRPASLGGQPSAGAWLVGSEGHLDRTTMAVVWVGSLAISVVLFFFSLFSLPALSCPERLLGCFLHELRFEGPFLREPTPTLLQGCFLPCVGEWKDFQSALILLCLKKTCLSYTCCTKAADNQGNTIASRQCWRGQKADAPLLSSIWKKGYRLPLRAARSF